MRKLSNIVLPTMVAGCLISCVEADPKDGDGGNNGVTNNGETNNGATNNGATNNGATNNGATNNSTPPFSAVASILRTNCAIDGCHGQTANKSYRIARGMAATDEDVRGAITDVVAATGRKLVEPSAPEQSEIYLRITGAMGLPRMPASGGPLAQSEIDTIEAWIAAGAP